MFYPFFDMKNETLIQSWLDSKQDYQTGVEIYRRVGRNEFLKQTFATGEDVWNKQKLLREMRLLAQSIATMGEQVPTVQARKLEIEQVLANDRKKPSERIEAPAVVREIVAQRKMLYKQTQHLRSKLLLYPTNQERLVAALEILDNVDKIKAMWKITDFYDLHQRMPQKVTVSSDDIVQLDDIALNQEWLIKYKYVMRVKGQVKFAEKIRERIERMNLIRQELNKRNAFQHIGLRPPDAP